MSDERYESVKHEFMTVPDSIGLAELVDREPFMADSAFLTVAEGWLAEAEAAGALDMAQGLRERIEVLRELIAQDTPSWREAIERFAAARDVGELAALIRDIPLAGDPSFQRLIEGLIAEAEQNRDTEDAAALRMRLEDLRQAIAGSSEHLTLASLLVQMQADDAVATVARTENPELVEQAERQALALLKHLTDQQQLINLVSQAPLVLDEPFLIRVEQSIAEAELENDTETAGGLRARLEGLRMIKAQVQVTLPQTLQAFANTRDAGDLLSLAQRVPFVLEESFITAVERAITGLESGGSQIEAEGLRVRLDALRQIRTQQEMAEESPTMQAIINFLNAPDDEAARQIFALQHDLLDTADAQQMLAEGFSGGDPESQQRIEERAQLLQTLRS